MSPREILDALAQLAVLFAVVLLLLALAGPPL